VNAQNPDDGFTAVHVAAKLNNIKMGRLLLTHGASLSIKDKMGRTPLSRPLASQDFISALTQRKAEQVEWVQKNESMIASQSLAVDELTVKMEYPAKRQKRHPQDFVCSFSCAPCYCGNGLCGSRRLAAFEDELAALRAMIMGVKTNAETETAVSLDTGMVVKIKMEDPSEEDTTTFQASITPVSSTMHNEDHDNDANQDALLLAAKEQELQDVRAQLQAAQKELQGARVELVASQKMATEYQEKCDLYEENMKQVRKVTGGLFSSP
jgi:Ankyrin repeat